MSSDDLLQERIDDYLLGKGSAEQRRELEEEISRNPELSAQLAETELALAAIEVHEDAALKARLQQLEKKITNLAEAPELGTEAPAANAKVVKMKAVSRSRRTWMAYAASLLLLIAAGWWLIQMNNSATPEQMAMANFEPYRNIAYTFERGSNDETLEADAYRAYEAGEFAAAAKTLQELPPSAAHSFYLGQSLLAQGKYAEAAPIFSEISKSTFGLNKESEYFLALAKVGMGQLEAARADLEKIIAVADHPSLTEAKALLSDL